MTELLDDLEQKRQFNNNEAERHRRLRDELNEKTKEWVQKRDELNGKVRELVDSAAKHRETRDKMNEQVRAAKDARDKFNEQVSELNKTVMSLKKDNLPRDGPPVSKLKKDLKSLEFTHMTKPLTRDKEKELVEQMKSLQNQIHEREKSLEANDEVKSAIKELRDAKDKAEEQHGLVSQLAESAQNEHDAMIKIYEEADKLRKDADESQEKFIETKGKADEEHRRHIDHIRQVHDYDKIITGLRQKARKARKKKDESVAMKEAEDIFDKFKRGEKLSTEDLMVLQKSGYL
ncbi:MAG TPA: phosphoserine phosphatase [Methanomassiliicoccales archaeon]|nr:phosphoserine phosphatase [Methanomassiliicoccales archaeon]